MALISNAAVEGVYLMVFEIEVAIAYAAGKAYFAYAHTF
jgi:hypothetical protein